MNQQPYFVLEIHRPGQPPETRPIHAPRQVLGRDGGDIPLGDGQASAMHAEIEFSNGQIVVRDLGSSNGTWKGDRALPQFAVSEGEEFRIGGTRLRVVQIVGGQPLRAGGTVMGDPNAIAQLKAQQAALRAGAAAAPPPTPARGGSGAAIAIVAGVLVVLGGGGAAAWYLLSDRADDTELAQAEVEDAGRDAEPDAVDGPTPPTSEAGGEAGGEPEDAATEHDLGQLYRQVGATTVLIRVPGSVGSGSIVDPSGIVLTNNHVIDGGERDGLMKKAKVTLGQFNEESQAFEPSHQVLDAYVLKVDVDHDLALIRLEKPPSGLPALRLAEDKPYPGQRVAALGHAGAGLLWAIKGGEIASTGKLSGHTELALEDASGFEKEMLTRIKDQMDKQGRVIQSTAKILPGDSGGPLVDSKGRLVGVNAFGRIDRATGQWLSFHVHLGEVQAFMENIPTKRLEAIPDPWQIKEADATYADVDLDGQVETLVVASSVGESGQKAYFLDLDQNSVAKGARPPKWEDLAKAEPAERSFDPELVVFADAGKQHFWYDSDNDDFLDVYMMDDGSGRVTEAYRLSKDAPAKREDGLIVDDGLDAKVLTDRASRERFERVGPRVFPGAVAPGSSGPALPDPLAAPGADGLQAVDHDKDGKWEEYSESTPFHQRTLWDLDQNGAGTTGGTGRELAEGKADIEVVAVTQRPKAWVWYDTDGDNRMDVVLETSQLSLGIATSASKIDGSGRLSPAPEHLGQSLLRPDLVPDSAQGERLRATGGGVVAEAMSRNDGLGRFPSPRPSETGSVLMRDVEAFPNAVAEVTENSHDVILVDIDHNSVGSKKDPPEAARRVREGKFDAEFALLSAGGMRWAFYDVDDDTKTDLVIFSPRATGAPIAAFQVKGPRRGKVVPVEPGPTVVQWGRFEDEELRENFSKIAPGVFGAQAGP